MRQDELHAYYARRAPDYDAIHPKPGRLADGSEHRLRKNFPAQTELQAMIEGLGEDGSYRESMHFWCFSYFTPDI